MNAWRATRESRVWILLAVAALAQVVPVWAVRFFVTQDGPAHVQNAVILRTLLKGDEGPDRIYAIYGINPRPVPNWTGHVFLAALSAVMSPRVAEKVLISLYVVGLPLAVGYAGRCVRRGGEWIGFLALPFVYSLALHKGLYNFCISLIVLFVLLGYVMRHKDQIRARHVLVIMVLSLVLYFSHIVSTGIAVVVVGGLGVGALIKGRWNRRQTGLVLGAFAPAVVLCVWFFFTAEGGASDHRRIGVQLLRFFELDALAALRKPELLVAIGFSILIWLTVIGLLVMKSMRRSWDARDGLLLIALALLVLYLAAPNSAAGGGQLSFRLSMYPYFIVMLWIATQPIAKPLVAVIACVSIALAAALVMVRWPAQKLISGQMSEYVSVERALASSASVVAIDVSRESALAQKQSWRIRPFWHAVSYVAAERGLFDAGNYETLMGYFPIVSHGTWSMMSRLSDDRVSQEERYALGTGADYVIVWSLDPANLKLSEWAQERLRSRYEVRYKSPHEMAVVWGKRASD